MGLNKVSSDWVREAKLQRIMSKRYLRIKRLKNKGMIEMDISKI